MPSFLYPTDLQYEIKARYPAIAVSDGPQRDRSALRINLDVWRARRAANRTR
jgi:hypothetical protein